MAFITSQGVMNAREGAIRMEMLKHADLVSAVRLPGNLFTEHAGTEVGSDLIILQKNERKQAVSETDKLFANTAPDTAGFVTNTYFQKYPERIVRTKEKVDTDPYGKPAMVYLHEGGVEGIAADMRKVLAADFSKHLDMGLYNGTVAEKTAQRVTMPEQKAEPLQEKPRAEEKPTEAAPAMNLYDLFNFTEEERKVAQSGGKRKQTGKKTKTTPPAQRNLFTQPTAKAPEPIKTEVVSPTPDEHKVASPPYDSEAVYAAIDWETNPPINGFYEAMMHLTPQQRQRLREGTQETVTAPTSKEKPTYPVANGFEEEHRPIGKYDAVTRCRL